MMQHKLKWWFMFWMSLAVLIGLSVFGFIQAIWRVDATHLGTAIITLYFAFSCWIGRLTALAVEANWGADADLERSLPACNLMVKSMVILGIIGTTAGLLLMLNAAFGGDLNPAVVLAGLKNGLSTLGITTLIGLACYLLLEIQVLNLEYAIKGR